MFGLSGGGSKKDDSKLGFGVPGLSLGNARETLGKATNTLRNTGEKVEKFFFGHHGSRTHTESSGGSFGLGGKGGFSLGLNVPSLGTPALSKPSHGFGLPSLPNLEIDAKKNLEKDGNAIEKTGEKAIDFLFGGRKKTPSLPGLSIDIGNENTNPSVAHNGINLNGILGNNKAKDTSLGVNLGEGKSSIDASLTLPNLTGVESKMKNDLGKMGGSIENTGKKAINFLFGGEKGGTSPLAKTGSIDLNAPPIPSLGSGKTSIDASLNLPSLSGAKNNLDKIGDGIENTGKKAIDFLFGGEKGGTSPLAKTGSIDLNAPPLPSLGSGKSSIDASLSLPSLSGAKNNLDKIGDGIENTGKKAIDFLFGGEKGGTSPLAKTGSIDLNAPPLSSLGSGKSSIDASLSLPSLSGAKNNLDKIGDGIENTGKKAIDFLFGGEKGGTSPLAKTGSIDLNAPPLPSLGSGKSSIDASLSLPSLSGAKNNLDKIGDGIENTGKKAIDFLFGGEKGGTSPLAKTGSIDLNAPPIPSLGSGKSSIDASLSLPNLSGSKNNLDKIGEGIENSGKKVINSLFDGDENGDLIPGHLPHLSNPSLNATTNNEQKGTTNVSIGLPRLPLGATPRGSEEKSMGLPEINLPKLGDPILVDLRSTKATNNTHTNIPLTGLSNLSSTVSLNEGAVPGIPPMSLSTTDNPITGTLDPLFEGFDKIFYTNNISLTEDGTTSLSSTYDDITNGGELSAQNGIFNYHKPTTSIQDSSNFSDSNEPINTSTDNHSIFNGNGNGFSIPYNITTESERYLKKIEETLRGSFGANLPTTSSTEPTTRKNENNVSTKTQTQAPTESIKPVRSSTLEHNQTTTEQPKKPKPAVIPPYFLVPNSNVTFGEGSEPVLPPSVFDNPTGKKAPFIPILPSSQNNHMGAHNLTDRGGVDQNPFVPPTLDSLSAVTYGAIGVGTLAIISIIIAFIYKAIKKARRSSLGGSYSPKSHHKEDQETRRSSSNRDANEDVVDSQVDQTVITHAVVNETTAEAKRNIRNVKSRAPDPQRKQDEIPDENINGSDLSQPGPSNTEVLNFETYDPHGQEKIQQEGITKKESPAGDVDIIHEQTIVKKNIIPIEKPPRKIDKANAPTGKFTSDKTAASNLNEDSLRSLGQALGGILKDQMPELDGNHKVGAGNAKKEKDFANDSDEFTSCTPPTTPTDLSDQETTKNDKTKKINVAGGEADADAFFSSGEMELDTGSEYFSADESTYAVRESKVQSASGASNFQEAHSNITLRKENEIEFVTEEGRRKSIEEDIADSLKIKTKTEEIFQEKNIAFNALKTAGHHRCISMCEDQTIDMEVQEILEGKEPYQIPSENSSTESTANSAAELQNYDQKQIDATVENISEEINSKNAPRNAHLNKIIDSGTSSNQTNSLLDANTVVDEIINTSKLDFVDKELNTSDIQNIPSIENEETKVHLEENILNIKNSNNDFFVQSKTTILDVEISGETFNKINDESSKTSEKPEQRNLIDYIVPKFASIDKGNLSKEDHQTDEDLGATSAGDSESSVKPPKWYVPFELSPDELTDPSRGNSDGLYIALSDETKLPHFKGENERQDMNSTSVSTKKSCAYININGDRGGIDEGWPNHIPNNHHENNMSGLGLLNTDNANGNRCGIQEELTYVSNKPADVKIQQDIPKFELPNMDKRLMRKRNLKRRQIKSLDSGVHGYYGEYIDLVEFPDLEGGQKITKDEEQKMNEKINNNNIEREIEEIKIEEDVVTILPDGSIREEKIVIDKISST